MMNIGGVIQPRDQRLGSCCQLRVGGQNRKEMRLYLSSYSSLTILLVYERARPPVVIYFRETPNRLRRLGSVTIVARFYPPQLRKRGAPGRPIIASKATCAAAVDASR
ncbi:hypothetical protein KCP77_18905 [Salmonella enterica subsp. enterica]|nr:hypothetical protein KCP77_18905 [Salmonella enterica subsp. enterica]